jgi:hypothetical protein
MALLACQGGCLLSPKLPSVVKPGALCGNLSGNFGRVLRAKFEACTYEASIIAIIAPAGPNSDCRASSVDEGFSC